EQPEGVLEPPAGAEDGGLLAVLDAGAEIRAVAELGPDQVAVVVQVDDDVADAVAGQQGDAVANDGDVAHRQEGLGQGPAEVAEPGGQAGAQQHGAGHRGPRLPGSGILVTDFIGESSLASTWYR